MSATAKLEDCCCCVTSSIVSHTHTSEVWMASNPNQTSGQTHVFITKDKNKTKNQEESERKRRAWQSLPEGV